MLSWLRLFMHSTAQTKYLLLVSAIFSIMLAVTTIYCYARLDYVRSYKTQPAQEPQKK